MTSVSSRPGRIRGSVPRPGNHVIVMFGATGDLARRKLLPGLFRLAAAGLMPDAYQIIGSSRRDLTGEQFREHARQAITEFGTVKPAGEAWEAFQRRLSFASAEPGRTDSLTAAAERAEREIGGRASAAVPSGRPAGRLRADGDHARRRGPGRRVPGHHREAVRHRSGLRPRAEPDRARPLRRVAGVPDRPLPRQGVGGQHPGLPVRQRPVRAGVEPPAHRLRADRRARDALDRGTRRFLRPHRRLPGHDRDPPVPGPGVRGHGAAHLAGRPAPARRDGQGVRRAQADRHSARGARPVRRLHRRARRGGRLRHRNHGRGAGRGRTTGGGPGSRSCFAPASAWRPAAK